MTLHDFLSRLDGVKGHDGQYSARCPAHDDKHSSLSISVGRDGRIILHCHAGCSVEKILEAMGLTMKDLFTEDGSQAKPVVISKHQYYSEDGEPTAQKLRYSDKHFSWRRPDGKGGWIYNRQGLPRRLYVAGKLEDMVSIVEGEKDADNLHKLGGCAVSGEDGAGPGKWRKEYTEQLRGRSVCIFQDNDDIGKAYALETAAALHGEASSVRLLDLSTVWPEIPEHGDVSDLIAKFGEDQAAGLIADLMCKTPEWKPEAIQDTKSIEDGWEQPIPFDTVETMNFPVESLPGAIGDFVECLASSTQTPEEMAGILALGVLSTAFQSRYNVEITSDWKEPLCLYTVAVAPPGERKSAVISALMKPVYEYEAQRRQDEAAEVEQNRTERALLEKQLQAVQTNAVKKKGNFEACRDEALNIAAQLATFEDKYPYRLVVDDTTPEKLVDIMDTQKGCITVASAEGGLFDSMTGRYEKGVNFDVYLKGHAGDAITVDRIGRKPNYIKDPRLSMLLTIQPEVLQGLMDNATFRGRGLCGRFLYAICKSKVGHRKIETETIPEAVKVKYWQFVRRICSDTGSGTIRLSPEAQQMRIDYAGAIEERLGGDWEYMRDWGGKLVGATIRIAALMHAAEVEKPTETPISGEVMGAAVCIAEFLGNHAEAAYQVMGANQQYADAKYLWHRIESTCRDEITKRDLYQLSKGKFKTVDELDPVLRLLVEMGYVREAEQKTGGRPSKMLMVNPQTKSLKSPKRYCA